MSADDAHAEAERRWPTDHREPNGVIRAMNDARQQGWDARGEWQASRPFTEEDVEAAAKVYPAAYQRAVQNAHHGRNGISREEAHRCYSEAMRAALDAVTARHTKGDGA